jgi:opacity protein-like surface antigen
MEVSMKKLLLLLGCVFAFGVGAYAQDTPKADISIGYSYVRFNLVPSTGVNTNGISASAAYNVHKNIGLVADFGGYFQKGRVGTPNLVSYMFGPRFSYRNDTKVTPFVQGLIGGATTTGPTGKSGFAFALGGGVDVKVRNNISLRVAQGEFFRTKIGDNYQNNLRFTAGVVFHIGKK